MSRGFISLLAAGVVVVAVLIGLKNNAVRPAPPENLPPAGAGNEPAISPGDTSSPVRRTFKTNSSLARPAAGPAWDKRVDEVLNSDVADEEKSKALLTLLPQLPPDQQEDVLPRLAALVADRDYAPLGNILTNTATGEAIAEILLTDLLDRPDAVKLPLLLDLARNGDHLKAEDARDLLEVLLGVNLGSDWDAWAKKISEWLASHPE